MLRTTQAALAVIAATVLGVPTTSAVAVAAPDEVEVVWVDTDADGHLVETKRSLLNVATADRIAADHEARRRPARTVPFTSLR